MLNKRQKEVLDYIVSYQKKKSYPPSLNEIKDHFGFASVSTSHFHVTKLRDSGHLTKAHNKPRSINAIDQKGTILIPLLGTITAGKPIDVIENNNESIAISDSGISKANNYYALRVKGNSMIEDGIFDNDIVVIKKQSVADNGQTVVAIIDDEQATLKKIYREKNRFRLQPANQTMLPFYRNEVEVRGVVIRIIRELEKDQKLFKTLDLFAGIGGIRIGFEKAGFITVFANDFEKSCAITYDTNFKDAKLIVEDIRKIDIQDLPDFDFLLAGFPCQAFSIAGYREGFNDKKGRGNLFFDITRIIEAKQPMGFLLENVKNLKSHDGGRTYRIIEKTLRSLGYHIKSKVLNSMEYGNVPQNRERIYIVGFKNEQYLNNFEFPEKLKLIKKVTGLLDDDVDEKYYYNGKPLYEKLKDEVKDKNKVYQWRRQYVRENKKGVCPTLTANMGTGGHNVPIIKDHKGIRKLTPKECSRIQGFPEDYKLPEIADSALYKQIGNSVSVPVVQRVATNIMRAINS